jgi:hypothetical protein
MAAGRGLRRTTCFKLAVALLVSTGVLPVLASDQSLQQILSGKPAAVGSGSGSYYDGQGAFAGRSSTSGSGTQLYDSQGPSFGPSRCVAGFWAVI